VYASRVRNADKDLKLTFYVSGQLWGGSLVMQDKETGSEWSHILGKSMAGKLKDTSLKIIPSEMTNWGSWHSRHPKTTVTMIPREANDFDSKMLEVAKRFGLGLVHGNESALWRFDRLQFEPLVNERMGELRFAVYYDAPNRTPYAWSRSISTENAHKELSFRMTAQGVQDIETNSVWDLRAGQATQGPLTGTRLEAVPAIVTFSASWERFHPDSRVWKPKSR